MSCPLSTTDLDKVLQTLESGFYSEGEHVGAKHRVDNDLRTIYTDLWITKTEEALRHRLNGGDTHRTELNDDEIAHVKISIPYDLNHVRFDYMEVHPDHRQQGIGTRAFCNIRNVCRFLKVDELSVSADRTNGVYTWAKLGMKPKDQMWKGASGIRDRYKEAKAVFEQAGAITPEVQKELDTAHELLYREAYDPTDLWKVIDLKSEVPGTGEKLGYAIFRNRRVEGVVHFSDAQSRDRMNDYVNQKLGSHVSEHAYDGAVREQKIQIGGE
ncbi:MAG: GNAT family N-acetyltransferase [Rickettsiales bacterium]|nr:GNAT family N-acetyltransferase [Rickettsiales bacterium]